MREYIGETTFEEALQEWGEATGKDVPAFMEGMRERYPKERLEEAHPLLMTFYMMMWMLHVFRFNLEYCIPSGRWTLEEQIRKEAHDAFPDSELASSIADSFIDYMVRRRFSDEQLKTTDSDEIKALMPKVALMADALRDAFDLRLGGAGRN